MLIDPDLQAMAREVAEWIAANRPMPDEQLASIAADAERGWHARSAEDVVRDATALLAEVRRLREQTSRDQEAFEVLVQAWTEETTWAHASSVEYRQRMQNAERDMKIAQMRAQWLGQPTCELEPRLRQLIAAELQTAARLHPQNVAWNQDMDQASYIALNGLESYLADKGLTMPNMIIPATDDAQETTH